MTDGTTDTLKENIGKYLKVWTINNKTYSGKILDANDKEVKILDKIDGEKWIIRSNITDFKITEARQ